MAAGLTSLSALLVDQLSSIESAGAKALSTLNQRNSSSIDTASSEALREQVGEAYGKLPLRFEANEGQADERVRFISRGVGYTLFLTADEAVLTLSGAQEGTGGAAQGSEEARNRHQQPRTNVLRMRLKGANPSPAISSLDEMPGRSNYFQGSDPAKWRLNVRNYARAEYSEVYPGIDLVYYGNQRSLEYDFLVAPGADPRSIALTFDGAQSIEVDAGGDLLLHTPGGSVRQRKPVIYQEVNGERQMVAGDYALNGRSEASFRVGDYDASKPLVIDPVLDYSTYLGGSGSGDVGYDVAVDADGNAYVTGYTNLDNFPTTASAFQRTFLGGPYDAFVTKFNPTGSALVYSTYLGGTLRDEGYGISVDAGGNAYITGVTISPDFPTTPDAFQPTFHGGPFQSGDAFVTKLNPEGSALVYSTYLGGAGSDSANSIAIDAAGNAYVTGGTSSTDFPTMEALRAAMSGVADAFVTKLNSTGTALVYSTYLGGALDSDPNGTTASDNGIGIAVDADNNAYVTGTTGATDFPTTPGAFQTTIASADNYRGDAFVTKLNNTGGALVYSTYLGGIREDKGNAIVVNPAGNAYVTGQTQSSDFPTKNPIRASNNADYDADAFVTKLNSDGSALVYSTYLGSSSLDTGNDIVVDSQNRATVTGTTNSFFFPIVNPPVQEKPGGSMDAFVTSLDATGTSIFYSSYVGGSGNEAGNGIGIDTDDNIYLTGSTTSITTNPFLNPFPTANPFQANRNGEGDAFVSKIHVGAASFSISGRLIDGNGGVSGTGVNLGGSRRERTVTDANGNYIFRNLRGGRKYTVTPVTSFGSFIPESTTFSSLNRNETANFALAYKIIGRIRDRNNNALAGVTVTLTGSQTGTTHTNSSGDYEFLNLAAGGSYTVTPSLAGSHFTPPKWTVNPLLNHQSLGFIAGPLPAPWTYESDIGSVGGAGSATYDNGTFTIYGSGANIGGTTDAFHYVHQRLTTPDGEMVARVTSIENTSPDAKAGIMLRDEDFSPESRYVAMLVTPSGSVLFQRRTATGGITTTTVSDGSAPVWLKLVRRGNDTYRGYKSVDGTNWQLIGSATIPMSQYLYVGMAVSSHNNSEFCAATFDNVAAKITITTPEEGAAFPVDSSIPISAAVSGPANKVDFYANDTLIGTDTTSPYAIAWDGVKSAGDYTLTARATDAQGTTPSSAVKIKIGGSTTQYVISGWVLSQSSGVKGVKMTLSGSAARTTTTLDDGSYSFTGLAPGGNYKVTPSRLNVTFTPASRNFTGLNGNKTNVNFAPAPVAISGVVKVGSTGLGGVRVTLTSPGLAARTVTTATSGDVGSFRFANLPAGRTYTLTPSKLSYRFTPTSRTYSNLIVNQTTANFAATLVTYSISGKVARTGTTNGINNVTMTITSPIPAGFAPKTVQTNTYGIYAFTGLPSGRNYTIKPTKSGFTFNPVKRDFTNLSGNLPASAATKFEGTQ